MQVIIYKDHVYLSHGSERARLIPTYHSLIQRVRLRVKLPDMVIPLNPGKPNSSCSSRSWNYCPIHVLPIKPVNIAFLSSALEPVPAFQPEACLWYAGDEPLAPLKKELHPPTPVFSFCKLSNYSDIMLPNTIEGDVFIRAPEKRAFRPKSRAGVPCTCRTF